MDEETSGTTERWRRHPRLAFLLRAAIVLVPVLAGIGAGIAMSRALPGTRTLWPIVGWWAAVLGTALLVQIVIDRLAHRLLPLAVLLRLSLLFPDHAPSRFAIALRSQSSRRLRTELDLARSPDATTRDRAAAIGTVLTLVAGLGAHDRASRGHSERVRAYVDLLAHELHLDHHDHERLCWAALLHDVGKITVAVAILNTPGTLDANGWAAIQRHPAEGARLAAPLKGWLGPWADAIEEHHEHYDGTGYPRGLAGDELSYGARIVAVADSFEVITAPRPYKAPRTAAAGRAELARSASTHFDPEIVRAFLNISIGRLRVAMGPLTWLGELPFLGGLGRVRRDAMSLGGSLAATFVALVLVVGVTAGGASSRLPSSRSPIAVLGEQLRRAALVPTSTTTTATTSVVPGTQQPAATAPATATTTTAAASGSSPGTAALAIGAAPTTTPTTFRATPIVLTTTTTTAAPTTTTSTLPAVPPTAPPPPPPPPPRTITTAAVAGTALPIISVDLIPTTGQPAPAMHVLALPAHGTLATFPGVAAALYTPDATYAGPDSFSYDVCAATCVVINVVVSVAPRPADREGG